MGRRHPGQRAGFAQEKAPRRARFTPLQLGLSARPPSQPRYAPGAAPRRERRLGAAARRAAARATAEAAGRARAHCRGARFGGRGSVQSSLFDGICLQSYTLISTCFLLLLLLLLRDLLLLPFLLRNFTPAVRSSATQPGKEAGKAEGSGRRQPVRSPGLFAEPRPASPWPEDPGTGNGEPGRAALGKGARRPRHLGAGGNSIPDCLRGCQSVPWWQKPLWKWMNGKLCKECTGSVGSTSRGSFPPRKLHGDRFLFRAEEENPARFQPRTERFHQTWGAHQVFGLMPQCRRGNRSLIAECIEMFLHLDLKSIWQI